MTDVAVVAGSVATAVFIVSQLPMLTKAFRSKDLSSYSPLNLTLANAGNAVQTVYVVSLPIGPLWGLHAFNVLTSGLMLVWWARYRQRPSTTPVQISNEESQSSRYRALSTLSPTSV